MLEEAKSFKLWLIFSRLLKYLYLIKKDNGWSRQKEGSLTSDVFFSQKLWLNNELGTGYQLITRVTSSQKTNFLSERKEKSMSYFSHRKLYQFTFYWIILIDSVQFWEKCITILKSILWRLTYDKIVFVSKVIFVCNTKVHFSTFSL